MTEAAAIVFVVDDDLSVREALPSLIRSIGWCVATFGSTPEVPTGNRPNAPGGSVANCHAPSIYGILPSVTEDVKGSMVREAGRTEPDASCTVQRPSP
jgi:FixJ family two-component response regulator